MHAPTADPTRPAYDMMDDRYEMMDGSGSAWVFSFSVIVLVILVLVLAAVLGSLILHLRQSATASSLRPPATADATRVLADRLAKGEVDPDEYRAIRALLDANG